MEHSTTAHTDHHDSGTKEIWRTFWILLVLTLVELAIGFYMYKAALPNGGFKHFLKGLIIILMLVKSFYIVAYFMHLKGELKNLIMTICVPLLLFVWFIIAFLYEGNSYRNLKNNYDRRHLEQSTIQVPKTEGSHETEAEKPVHH
jgi:cytochrome c oxidase subunit IV